MSKPRIIAGSAKGRALETPRRGTRPSPARVREALFNILQARPPDRFLDLFAGSGAVGLEAASRGWRATLVDVSPAAADVIRRNARNLELEAEVVRADALRFAREHPEHAAVVFAAPPYPEDLDAIFQSIVDSGPARRGGLYVLQHPSDRMPRLALDGETAELDTRTYGSNALSLLHAT